ncbi:hypothetical protein C8J27_10866 [Rhodobacter aestuarii]|uniref:Uncharacterized protein n=1 Tax=Rhodobacter aestuarii TaxID=453582 RepID=A0A1N7PL04_9RHOB|nr:hypothetical protein [Rhodobacter aestuarii]PTV94331.1 hypothetical protein C8J27_10866 [Rhodobacter aestuarii]SIT11304.1 hypothetical protein SAMN05421580_11095 [Rhodobacter aestuarii]
MSDDSGEKAEYHFTGGRIDDDGQSLVLTAVRDDIEEALEKRMYLFFYYTGEWTKSYVDNLIADIRSFDTEDGPTLISVAPDGEVIRSIPEDADYAQVDPTDNGPNDLRAIKGLSKLGNTLLCYGMRRQVYRSDLRAMRWVRADTGVFVTENEDEVAGFLGLDGTWPDNLVAVGMQGDLWTKRKKWVRREVPTNVNLTGVKMLEDGRAVVCGGAGVVLIGRDDTWDIVPNDATEANFWDIAEFKGKLYLAAETGGLFTIEDGAVVAVDLPKGMIEDVSALDANAGKLLLIGDQQVVWFDGESWTDLEAPII